MSEQAPGTQLPPAPGPGDRLTFCVFLAGAVHAALILGVTFTSPEQVGNIIQSLEVTLAQHSDSAEPEEADFLAAANQQGSGTLADKRETTTTEVSEFHDNVVREVREETAPEEREAVQNAETTEVITGANESTVPVAETPREAAPEVPARRSELRQIDIARAIATLEARLAMERQEYARRPRIRRLTSVSTRSAQEAYYLSAWRRRIETIGNLNYPAEARRRRLSGNLRLMVAVNADGSLHEVRVLDSSGLDVLDDAAVRIVRLAAPFSPFPPELARQTDILEIIRTWRFGRDSYFSGGQL